MKQAIYHLSCYAILTKTLIRKTYKCSLLLIIQNLLSHKHLLVILAITWKSDILVCENSITAVLLRMRKFVCFCVSNMHRLLQS